MLGTSLISDTLRSRYEAPLQQELRQSFAGQKGLLYDMLVYQLGWVDEQGTSLSGPSGEHLHPCLCLLSCESLSGEFDVALPAAAAVELVHNFILIHEDVQSGSPNRGHRPSVWWTWGPGQAINAGDGMHALGRLALMRLQERGLPVARVLSAMLLLDRACLSMCEGQHMDLVFQERLDVGVDAYLKMAEGRSGALMSCAMALGALASTEDEAALTAFKECGRNLGIAHQIRADIADLEGTVGEDGWSANVLNKKKLLPIVYALQTGDLHTKRELGTIYFKRVLEPQDVQRLVGILEEGSALEYARDRVREYCEKATDSLDGLALSPPGKEELQRTCRRLMGEEG